MTKRYLFAIPIVIVLAFLIYYIMLALWPLNTPEMIRDGTFIFDHQPAGCELPCWQGLRLNESTVEDVQTVYVEELGLLTAPRLYSEGGSRNAFHVSYMTEYGWNSERFQDALGHEWKGWNGNLEIDAIFDPETDKLIEMQFHWRYSDDLDTQLSLESVIEHLGTPTHLWIGLGPQENGSVSGRLAIGYEQGVAFHYYFNYGDQPGFVNRQWVPRVCFSGDEARFFSGEMYLTKPIPVDEADWHTFLQETVAPNWAYSDAGPLEDWVKLSNEEFADQIAEISCFSGPYLFE